ncbi:related to Serine/threonine-protein kinase VPS15 [Saccharomycodes ludwigii]|uniref:non-specific serine/threonine protein kinase n=1 Tax=Saccharomycodes ludwigii TaxID=36035 RepID=A0A376B527_9ASCO|nr:related to Serine/threonine-protein kinase VPS15 [Saccharomycodes ludwigii]
MGQQLSLLAQTAPSIAISSYVDVLKDIHYISQLNSSKFLKTCKALDINGEIIIKIFLKPTIKYNLQNIVKLLERESFLLRKLPNVLHYTHILETDRAGYLIRQHLNMNLYDRLSTRPFFQDIELKFVCFQILQILKDIHSLNCAHGDIKLENFMITTWGWVVLTDFSNHIKPVYIPEDNPNEYSFYFDISQRRICYLAPERFDNKFSDSTLPKENYKLDFKMDIFSAGCCLFEIFTEGGKSLFSFSQIFKYKNKEYDPATTIEKELTGVDKVGIRNMILDMINLDPNKRLSAVDLLEKYKGTVFPEYFYTFAYKEVRSLNSNMLLFDSPYVFSIPTLQNKFNETFNRFFNNIDSICNSLHYPLSIIQVPSFVGSDIMTMQIKLNSGKVIQLKKYSYFSTEESVTDQSALILISILIRFLRNLSYPEYQINCLDALIVLSQYVNDDAKLDIILPYFLVVSENNTNRNIQAVALQKTVQLLCLVENINQVNENILVDYVLPKLIKIFRHMKDNKYGRIIFAQCMGQLSNFTIKLQGILLTDATKTEKQKRDGEEIRDLEGKLKEENVAIDDETFIKYTSKMTQLFENLVISLLIDDEVEIKLSFLSNVASISRLFGPERTNDIILSHLITYLNDRSSSLRSKVIQVISAISVILGPVSFEQYVLPLLIQAIADPEELVVISSLKSLLDSINVGLVKKHYYYDLCAEVAPLILHPNEYMRQLTISLLVEISSRLQPSEKYCLLYPVIKPYFELELDFTNKGMILGAKNPIDRRLYNLFYTWCLSATNTLFWKRNTGGKNPDAFGNNSVVFVTKDYMVKNYGFRTGNITQDIKDKEQKIENTLNIPLTIEDKNWIEKLQNTGLKESDIWKLGLLRVYVFKAAKMSPRKSFKESLTDSQKINIDSILSKKNVLPHNCFFKLTAIPEYKKEKLHVIAKQNIDNNTTNINTLRAFPPSPPRLLDLNGSLFLNTPAEPTLTQCFDSVYVQLEPSIENDQSSKISKISPTKFKIVSSYEGRNDSIKFFLKSVKIVPPLKDYPEFGLYYGDSAVCDRSISFSECFVSHITECYGENITAVSVSSHKPYMVTGSDSGHVKLWDIQLLCENDAFTCLHDIEVNSPVTNVAFLWGYNCFTLATKDGEVKTYAFDIKDDAFLLSDIRLIRTYQLENNQYALKILHMDKDFNHILFILTNDGIVLSLDIRNMKIITKITNKTEHGSVVSLLVAPDMSWILLGTIYGMLDLWDLRFGVLTKSWCFGDNLPILELYHYPQISNKSFNERNVVVIGGCSTCLASLWDITKVQCKRVIRKSSANNSINVEDYISKELLPPNYVFDAGKISLDDVLMDIHDSNVFLCETQSRLISLFGFRNAHKAHVLLGPDKNFSKFSMTKITTSMSTIERKTSTKVGNNHNIKKKAEMISLVPSNIKFMKAIFLQGSQVAIIFITRDGSIQIYK